jgi:hypothetical protein
MRPFLLVPGERFELPTNGLQNRCSTTELTRHSGTLCTSENKLLPEFHRGATFSIRFERGRL